MDDDFEAEQTESMDFLEPLLVHFHEGWHGAQSRYRSYDPEHLADHDDTCAANCVRCHMWGFVQNQIGDMPGVNLLDVRGLKLLNYHDKYVLRFKKVDRLGLHQNYQTEQQDDFDRNVVFPEFPSEAIRLT